MSLGSLCGDKATHCAQKIIDTSTALASFIVWSRFPNGIHGCWLLIDLFGSRGRNPCHSLATSQIGPSYYCVKFSSKESVDLTFIGYGISLFMWEVALEFICGSARMDLSCIPELPSRSRSLN